MKHTDLYRLAAASLLGAAAVCFALPAAAKTVALPEFRLREQASLWDALPQPILSDTIITMQQAGIDRGGIIYRTRLASPLPEGSTLSIDRPGGLALLFADGVPVGKVDGQAGETSIKLPALESGSVLEIFVDASSPSLADGKGITHAVTFTTPSGETAPLLDWRIIPVPLDYTFASTREYSADALPEGPAFYRGSFRLDEPASTHLYIGKLGRGIVWLNGRQVGSYNAETPDKTLLLPESDMKAGDNEIIVFDDFGPSLMRLSGMDHSFSGNVPSAEKKAPSLDPDMIVVEGKIAAAGKWQEAELAFPVESRYVAVELGGADPSLAGIKIIGPGINSVTRERWKIENASPAKAGNDAAQAIDSDDTTFWRPDGQTGWMIIDMGSPCSITSVSLLSTPGTTFRIYAL